MLFVSFRLTSIMACSGQASSSKKIQRTVLKPKSIVWKLFNLKEQDHTKTICTLCNIEISRGTKINCYNTSNMLKHLTYKHKNELKKEREKKRKLGLNVLEEKKIKACVQSTKDKKQPSLFEIFNQNNMWGVNDHRAKKIHQLIGEMIAVDLQPFSIIEDIGFKRLMNHMCPNYQIPSKKFIEENIVPDIYKCVKNNIKEEINAANHISFTTNGWSASTGNNSFVSLTAHWINDTYEQKSAILGVTPFEVTHTASNIIECLQNTMEEYQIPDNKIHLIVSDNAANMTAGVTQAGYHSLGCFMHTLQQVLMDAIFEQRYVKDIIAICQQIVAHFNQSPSAFAEFTEYQIKFNLPEHRFIQDVDASWNSQYYMLARVCEQQIALIAYCSDHSGPSCLGTYQWKELEKLEQILKYFVDCTNILSTDNAIASSIIPSMKVLCHGFDKGEAKGFFAELGSTLSAWKASVKNRFGSYFNDRNLILATYLDPRFKTAFLTEECNKKDLEESLLQWMTEDISLIETSNSMHQASESTDVSIDIKSDDDMETFLDLSYDSIFAEFKNNTKEKQNKTRKNTQEDSSFISIRNTLKIEMTRYHNQEMIKKEENSLQWWAANEVKFATLSTLAKKYLSAPPSTVQSEKLFSIGGIVYSPKRNRLTLETGEMLMFLRYNLPIMGFTYD